MALAFAQRSALPRLLSAAVMWHSALGIALPSPLKTTSARHIGAMAELTNTSAEGFGRAVQGANEKCVTFYHVAKCAGSSIDSWAKKAPGVQAFVHRTRIDDRELSSDIASSNYFSGHFGCGLREYLGHKGMRRSCYEFTVLRHPFERVVSNWYFSRGNMGQETNAESFMERYSELENFALHSANCSNLPDFDRDHVTRISTDSHDYDMYVNHMCRQFSCLANSFDRWSPAYYHAPSCTCDVERAKTFLTSLQFVGFTEEMEHVWSFLGRVFESDVAKEHTNEGVTNPGFEALPKELQARIAHANAEDLTLYKWAREYFA